jgi:hypothetical protein
VRGSLIVIIAVTLAAALAASAYAFSYLPKIDTSAQSSPKTSTDFNDQIAATENMTDTHSAMLSRGNVAMGFDQNKIIHHFMASPTGGQIMIVALESRDGETISQIKTHVLDIQYEFSQGNFAKPFYIHDQEVPGTDIMTEKKDLIKYSVQDLKNGAILILTTDDAELRKAIQEFMAFQGSEHRGH